MNKLFSLLTLAVGTTAFNACPSPAFSRTAIYRYQSQVTTLAAEPDEEEEGLDLNLEEMFDM